MVRYPLVPDSEKLHLVGAFFIAAHRTHSIVAPALLAEHGI